MNSHLLLSAFILCAMIIATDSVLLAEEQPSPGQELHDLSCISCHARRFGGEDSRMYTRSNRRMKHFNQLREQVAFCNVQVGAQWFDDEVDTVTDYLNNRYYHFPVQ